jgi:hypothetical protein
MSSPVVAIIAAISLIAMATGCATSEGTETDASLLPDDAAPPIDMSVPDDVAVPPDRAPLDRDAACASATAEATVVTRPVDIIWVVDNSVSMQPAIDEVQAGLDDFAALIAGGSLDYRVILLSLRGQGQVTVGGSTRYAICIPPPLSSDNSCGDGPNFFHVSVDIRSTQPIEQFLGTLGQTSGYTASASRGSDPWLQLLRPNATKSLVFVTDDNARTCVTYGGCNPNDPPLTAASLEDFPGGPNPYNSNELGPGILTSTYGTLFQDYRFHAIYGWGSTTDPSVKCTYADSSKPPSSGPTYTALVQGTGGVRGQICDGSSAWAPFFNAVAAAVGETSQIDCTIPIPEPPANMIFERDRINVWVDTGSGPFLAGKVDGAGSCGTNDGWYYNDENNPTAVVLCPATCTALQSTSPGTRKVDVEFGCLTIVN